MKGRNSEMSAKAFVLINVEPGLTTEIVAQLNKANHVKAAYTVTGPYDAIAELVAEDYGRIAELVEDEVRKMEGIEKTMTLVVF
jgi:DNA-binding Lrp family transcriptional regulator